MHTPTHRQHPTTQRESGIALAARSTHDDTDAAAHICRRTSMHAPGSGEGGGEAQHHAHPAPVLASPATRIYRHALESVLGMLPLADLLPVVAVSREWSSAVRSMATILAPLERDEYALLREGREFRSLPPIARLVGSPLLHQLAAIHIKHADGSFTPLTNAALALLARHAPNLQSLWCTLVLAPLDPLLLPATLQSLHLRLSGKYASAVSNGVLTALCAVPSLSRLCLGLKLASFADRSCVDLRLLAACPSLTDLTLTGLRGGHPRVSGEQIDQIRSSLGHLRRVDVKWMNADLQARFLQQSVTARWQDIGLVVGYERTGELLLRLPITTLQLRYHHDTSHLGFLPQLPLLTALRLTDYHSGACAGALLASLSQCPGLTALDLSHSFVLRFDTAQSCALFANLPSIKQLSMDQGIQTLRCFAAGPITHSLEELSIGEVWLSELAHLCCLRRLRTLHLRRPCLDGAAVASLFPPTPLLPALTKLSRSSLRGDGQWDHREWQGPSYEWMQARLVR